MNGKEEKQAAHRFYSGSPPYLQPLSVHSPPLRSGRGLFGGPAGHGPGYGVYGGQLLRLPPPHGRLCYVHHGAHPGGLAGLSPGRRRGPSGRGVERGCHRGGLHRLHALHAGRIEFTQRGGGPPAPAGGRVRHRADAPHRSGAGDRGHPHRHVGRGGPGQPHPHQLHHCGHGAKPAVCGHGPRQYHPGQRQHRCLCLHPRGEFRPGRIHHRLFHWRWNGSPQQLQPGLRRPAQRPGGQLGPLGPGAGQPAGRRGAQRGPEGAG